MTKRIIILLVVTICNHLHADVYLQSNATVMEPKNELEQLTVIMAKYGNNPIELSALNYAVLQGDGEAFDLLIKYGATPGSKTLYYAIKTGHLDLFKKIADMGVGVSIDYDMEWPIMSEAIHNHHNDIVIYLLENGNRLGFDYLKHKSYMLERCSEAGNDEMYNVISSMEPTSH